MHKNQIGIINYGAGNIFSLTAALSRLSISYGMVDNLDQLEGYDRFIIPGVGHAGSAMDRLHASGLVKPLLALNKPVLGICVGMQLLTDFSEEGNKDMLGLFPLKTLHFEGKVDKKIPHMGWNTIQKPLDSPLFEGIPDGSYFYFVHSYFIEYNPTFTSASCTYGIRFSAAIQREQLFGVQFHPEKSGKAGEKLLTNFATL
jgi:glutamine amidotransferase